MKLLLSCLFFLFAFHTYAQVIALRETNYVSDQGGRWSFIGENIGSDSIVCLGEESHWIETYLEVKNGIIKSLHKNKGFDVVIFESGFINAFVAHIKQLDSLARLKETMYTIWQTKAVFDLVNYMGSSRGSENPMIQLGCDLKGPPSFGFSTYLRKALLPVNPGFSDDIFRLDSMFVETRSAWEPAIGEAHRTRYLSDQDERYYRDAYEALIDTVSVYAEEIKTHQGLSPAEFEFFKRCLSNRLYLLNLMQLPTYPQKHKYRDSIMAMNIRWLIQDFVPDQKYIVWGADIHISKNGTWELMGEDWADNRSMIEILDKEIKKDIHSISIKPFQHCPKALRKRIMKKEIAYYYMDFGQSSTPDLGPLRREFDGIIYCVKLKGIKKYVVP